MNALPGTVETQRAGSLPCSNELSSRALRFGRRTFRNAGLICGYAASRLWIGATCESAALAAISPKYRGRSFAKGGAGSRFLKGMLRIPVPETVGPSEPSAFLIGRLRSGTNLGTMNVCPSQLSAFSTTFSK